jgi:hypothetical protein
MNAEGIREAQYEIIFIDSNFSFFILHFSLNFAKQNSFGRAASLHKKRPAKISFGRSFLLRSRRAIRSITFGLMLRISPYGGSATIPLASALSKI